MMLSRKVVGGVSGLLFAIPFFVGCGVPDPTSELEHNTSQPVRSLAPWNWVEVSQAQFNDTVLADEMPDAKPVPTEFHPLNDRVSFWVNALDAHLRVKYPEAMQGVPVPHAQVLNINVPNAFITSAFTCYDVPVKFGPNGKAYDKVLFDLSPTAPGDQPSPNFVEFPDKMRCIPADAKVLKIIVDTYNQANTKCNVTLTPTSLDVGSGCTKEHDDMGSARRLIVARTANWVTVHSALFATMPDEPSFVGVIAHELGHYYRSHGTEIAPDYNFFYTMGAQNSGSRPIADPALEKFGLQAKAASEFMGSRMPTVEGQKIASELYLAAGSVAVGLCKASACAQSCQQLVALRDDMTFLKGVGAFPFMPVNSVVRYRQFEQLARSCLSSASYSSTQVAFLKEAISQPSWIPFGKMLTPNKLRVVMAVMGQVYSRVENLHLPETDYFSLFQWVTNAFKTELMDAKNVLARASRTQLGQYTIEQEADEEGLEWLTDLGFEPKAMTSTFLTLASLGDDTDIGGYIIAGATCSTLAQNGWKDENGLAVYVPLGDYSEIHHSSCFRAFNVDREITAHRFSRQPISTAPSDGLTWADLQSLAGKLPDPVREELANSAANQSRQVLIKRKNRVYKTCPFSPHKL